MLTNAQVGNYIFSQNAAITNTDVVFYGGTTIQTTSINNVEARREIYINNGKSTATSSVGPGYPIGFDFWYDGQFYNSFGASANGYIKLGNSADGIIMLNDTSFTSFYSAHPERENIIAAFMRKSFKQPVNNNHMSYIRYEVNGYPGERRLSVHLAKQFSSQSYPYYYTTESYARLYEFDNTVEVVNLSDIPVPVVKDTAVVGLLGAGGLVSNNYSVRKVTDGINDWKTSIAGNQTDGFCEFSNTLRPVHTSHPYSPMAISYKWKPAPLTSSPAIPIAYFKQLQPGNPNFIPVRQTSYFDGGYIMASNAVDVQLVQTIYWSPLYSSSPVQYDLYFGLDSLTLVPLAINLGTNNYKLPLLSENTKYFYKIISRNSSGSSPAIIYSFTTGSGLDYCVSHSGLNCTLQNFTLNTMNYSMSGTIDNTASYPKTTYHTELKRDTTYKFQYTPVSGLPCFTIILFIDFNHNGILNDPGEKFMGNNASIVIPRAALLGPTKMRITQQSGCSPGNYDPCNAVNYQDFVVTIVPELVCKTFSIAPIFNGSTCYNMNDGSISLNPTGGTTPYNYTWIKDNSPTTLQATANNLSSGNYQCIIKDANNCVLATNAMALQQPLPLHIDTSTVAGKFTVNVTGGTSPLQYEWFDGSTTYSENPTEGTYTLSISDANNCEAQMLNVTIKKELLTNASNVELVKDIKLYPNPSTGIVTINIGNLKENLVVAILDVNGKTIRQQQIQNSETIIDLSGQNTGMYFFKVSTNSTSEVHKIFLE